MLSLLSKEKEEYSIHFSDNVSFLKGGLHASCNNIAFEGGQLATIFVSKVSHMHLHKNLL
jgi:hypothetical protein